MSMSIPTYGRPIRWSIAAAAATTLFALLLASGWLLFDALGQTNPCENGTVVPNPTTNTGLVADCQALWAGKDAFLGTATPMSGWNATTAISSWSAISLGGTPERVTTIYSVGSTLFGKQLDGTLPPELGNLSALTTLWLGDTRPHRIGTPPTR